ncbi:hypothetical protein E4U15_001821 [Claviceps sp. LM218 group G6]|nr:hypothetical protein E4U15_001821 [Claviceps sp. LM218 group G6]
MPATPVAKMSRPALLGVPKSAFISEVDRAGKRRYGNSRSHSAAGTSEQRPTKEMHIAYFVKGGETMKS